MKLFIWRSQPSYLAFAHAESIEKARTMLLADDGELGPGGDGSCIVRDRAREVVRTQAPAIFHGSTSAFVLSDSAELEEQEDYSRKLSDERDALRAENAALRAERDRLAVEQAHEASYGAKLWEAVQPNPGESVIEAVLRIKAENANLRQVLVACETWRRSYADAKYRMYSMRGAWADYAMAYMPCSEGPLERAVDSAIGTEGARELRVKAHEWSDRQQAKFIATWPNAEERLIAEKTTESLDAIETQLEISIARRELDTPAQEPKS